jgi:D-aminopeptidase
VFTYTVATKRAYLRTTYASRGSLTLLEALTAKLTVSANSQESGQIVRQTSSSDVSVEFAEPGKGTAAPLEMLEMWESLLGDYDYAVTLLSGDGITSPTDLQIYNKMLGAILIATTRYYGDFTQFRREPTVRMS